MNDSGGSRTAQDVDGEPASEPGPETEPEPAQEDRRATVGTMRANLIGAGAFLVVGLYSAIYGLDLGYWHNGPGAGFFPFWMGALIVLLSAVWGVRALQERVSADEEPAHPRDRQRMLSLLAALLAAVMLMSLIGYQLAMTCFVFYALVFLGRRGWIESALIAAVAGFGVYMLFAGLLQVYLPTASLPLLAQLGL